MRVGGAKRRVGLYQNSHTVWWLVSLSQPHLCPVSQPFFRFAPLHGPLHRPVPYGQCSRWRHEPRVHSACQGGSEFCLYLFLTAQHQLRNPRTDTHTILHVHLAARCHRGLRPRPLLSHQVYRDRASAVEHPENTPRRSVSIRGRTKRFDHRSQTWFIRAPQ